jgi:hypothetical protein
LLERKKEDFIVLPQKPKYYNVQKVDPSEVFQQSYNKH